MEREIPSEPSVPLSELYKSKLLKTKNISPPEPSSSEQQASLVVSLSDFESDDVDSPYILQGMFDGDILIFSLTQEKVVHTLKGPGYVMSILNLGNGMNFLSAHFDGVNSCILLWDFIEKRELKRTTFTNYMRVCMSLLHNPSLFAVGTGKSGGFYSIGVFSTFDLNRIRNLKGHNRTINALVYLNDKQTLVSADCSGFIIFFNYRNGEAKKKFNHSGGVLSLAFNKRRKLLISGGFDQSICIWDALYGYMISKIDNYHNSWVRCLLSLDHCDGLVTSGDDFKSNIFDLTDAKKPINFWKEEDFAFRNEAVGIVYIKSLSRVYICKNARSMKVFFDV